MNESKKMLRGSDSRDEFKVRHKQLNKGFYACDIDLALITKTPGCDIICVIDYKTFGDSGVPFSEVIAYNALIQRGIMVFIVQGDVDAGRFVISRYEGGNHKKPTYKLREIRKTNTWTEFEQWEHDVRNEFNKRFGL